MNQQFVRNTVIQSASLALSGKNVAWQNKAFKPSGGTWFSVYYLPSNPTQMTLGVSGEEELRAILQIDVNVPTDSGEKDLMAELSLLEAFYPSGRVFSHEGQSATVLSCARSTGRVSNASWRVSLSVYFRSRYKRQPLP